MVDGIPHTVRRACSGRPKPAHEREGEMIEWNDRGAFVSQTTYERGVDGGFPEDDVLVDDPAFAKR